MALGSEFLGASKEFLDLFKAGKAAARKGDRAQAHALFRRAIEIDPYHEQIWLWLATVVDQDADKRVCFENVLQLNPSNPTARQQLQRMSDKEAIAEARRMAQDSAKKKRAGRRWLRRAMWLIVLSVVSAGAVLAATVLL